MNISNGGITGCTATLVYIFIVEGSYQYFHSFGARFLLHLAHGTFAVFLGFSFEKFWR